MHMDVIAALAVESVGFRKQAGLFDIGKKVVGALGRGTAKAAPKVSSVASKVPSAPTANAALGATVNTAAKAAPAVASAATKAPRSFMSRLGRTSAVVGAGGAGAVGVGHYNNSRNEAKMNPFESYRHHTDALNQMTQPIQQQLADASARGDMEQVQSLMGQLESGDFGASKWSLGGLNPWAEAGAGSRMETMRNRTSEASNQFTDATNKFGDKQKAINTQIASIQQRLNQPGMLPQQKALYQSTLGNLQSTLKGLGTESADAARIRTQAQEAGMVEAGGAFPTPGGPAQLGAASVPPPAAAPAAAPASPPNANPLLAGGASGAPMSYTSFPVAPKW